MSGHSKWSQIKHKKTLTDQKKGQLFSKLARIITVAAKKGTDPNSNSELSRAIEKARGLNMPRENIDRAIAKVSDNSEKFEEFIIEALGPGGIALKISGITDNRNRTIAEVRKLLEEAGAKMVQPGSISWMFSNPVTITDPQTKDAVDSLLSILSENEDINNINTNLAKE